MLISLQSAIYITQLLLDKSFLFVLKNKTKDINKTGLSKQDFNFLILKVQAAPV